MSVVFMLLPQRDQLFGAEHGAISVAVAIDPSETGKVRFHGETCFRFLGRALGGAVGIVLSDVDSDRRAGGNGVGIFHAGVAVEPGAGAARLEVDVGDGEAGGVSQDGVDSALGAEGGRAFGAAQIGPVPAAELGGVKLVAAVQADADSAGADLWEVELVCVAPADFRRYGRPLHSLVRRNSSSTARSTNLLIETFNRFAVTATSRCNSGGRRRLKRPE